MSKDFSRKSFLKKFGATTLGAIGMPYIITGKGNENVEYLDSKLQQKKYAANDRINIAIIGAGIMGQQDVEAALENEGVQLVAACDLYESRLVRCQERWGEEVDTTMDYREVLARDDVDSVIIATPDFWHDTIAIAALEAGKAVYLEKPMVQHIEEG
ncbi:MAG: Gfo/Idh/MocA family oxidoreductase, partial [Balneolaceae bacterium]|nr:Gfo/Idh/MocA family oxidoreductase [Balneolaceae bacterium]